MKEQVQQLIATGQTEEALQLLVQSMPDAILLQARYNQGKKQYNMGLIEFGEWSRIQAQINYAALELAGSKKINYDTPVTSNVTTPTKSENGTSKKVFISYSHKDWEMVEKIKNFLESKQIDVKIDREDLSASEKIRDFIVRNFKDNDFILFVASTNSLRSGWVGYEQTLASFAELLDKLKVISVCLDEDCFRDDLPLEVAQGARKEIAKLDELIEQHKTEGIPFTHLTTKRQRLEKFRLGASDLMDRLQNSLTLDVSAGNFEENMSRVLAAIKKD